MLTHFSMEKHTGAIDGYYAIKQDMLNTAKELSIRWEGSEWLACSIQTVFGTSNTEVSFNLSHRTEAMNKRLTSLFKDTYQY